MPFLSIIRGQELREIEVPAGTNLRLLLLEHGYSPYTKLTSKLNCGGRGLCATCGVWVREGRVAPRHWHDKAAAKFSYPRLSCQISIEEDLTIEILQDKWIWGKRERRTN